MHQKHAPVAWVGFFFAFSVYGQSDTHMSWNLVVDSSAKRQ